ncbi:MAG: CAP domain-containing protein [Chitinophagaceae bacterium]
MKTTSYLFIVFSFFLFSVFSCRKDDIASNDTPDNSAGLNESLMLQLVNQQRQQGCNCGTTYYPPTTTLTWNDQLEAAALFHASDMNENNYFNHTGLNGSSPGDRISNAGYNWKTYGENIAKGYTSEQSVMNGWIASEGHCKNIMNPNFREFGAAKAGAYWVQEFGAK